MTGHDKLAAELDSLRREFKVISFCVWGVAIGVMIYGLGNVYGLLTAHDVPNEIAWILSPMVDAGLCVGLVGTRGLARHGINAGWIGALRWVTGAMTWSLNIASPLTKDGGPDKLGVFIHSVGPLLLFVVVEGAAYYQHRMGKVIAAKQASLEAADERARAEQAERVEMRDRLSRLTADLTAAAQREKQYTDQLTELATERETESAALRHDRDVSVAEAERLQVALTEHAEKAERELTARLTEERAKRTEEIQRLRAEMGTVNLSDYRRGGDRSGRTGRRTTSAETPARGTLTDEAALQKLLAENDDPNYEWSQAEIRRVTGVGFGRTARLLTALTEYHRTAASERGAERSIGTAGERSDDLTADEDDRAVEPSLFSIGA